MKGISEMQWNGFNAYQPGKIFVSKAGAAAYEVLPYLSQTHILVDVSRLILDDEVVGLRSLDMVAVLPSNKFLEIYYAMRENREVNATPLREFCESIHIEVHPDQEVYLHFVQGKTILMSCILPVVKLEEGKQ